MSYARIGPDSDVYVFVGVGGWECCGCSLSDARTYETPDQMLDHLAEHLAAGDKVPADALRGLREDAAAFRDSQVDRTEDR